MSATPGYLPPTPEHRILNNLYGAHKVTVWTEPPASFEKTLPIPYKYHDGKRPKGYNQGNTPRCVGYSGAWGRTIDASIAGLDKYFDADWLYQRACKIGKTTEGAYIWAALDALRNEGAKELINGQQQGPDPEDKILSYVWAKDWTQVRTAIWNDQPVWFGIPWPWNEPQMKDGEPWVGLSWGPAQYGHAITGYAWSDKRQAVGLVNTWGGVWPRLTWFGKDAINYAFKRLGGECAIVVDQYIHPDPPPPPPPPPPVNKEYLELHIDGWGSYSGEITRVK